MTRQDPAGGRNAIRLCHKQTPIILFTRKQVTANGALLSAWRNARTMHHAMRCRHDIARQSPIGIISVTCGHKSRQNRLAYRKRTRSSLKQITVETRYFSSCSCRISRAVASVSHADAVSCLSFACLSY